MNELNKKILYVSVILILSIITNVVYIELTPFTIISCTLNPLYMILGIILLCNIIINIIPNVNKKMIKLGNYLSLGFFIATMASLYYRNMMGIANNVLLEAVNMYNLYNLSYGLLITTYFVIIMFLNRSVLQDGIITGYQIVTSILCLLIEIQLHNSYWTHPTFDNTIFIVSAIQYTILLMCIIYTNTTLCET